jgi:hypothetical protein
MRILSVRIGVVHRQLQQVPDAEPHAQTSNIRAKFGGVSRLCG